METMRIPLKQLLTAETLSTRQSVDLINIELQKRMPQNEHRVVIYFTDITQISRSFADEILQLKRTYSMSGIQIEFKNLNDFVTRMIDLVSHKAFSVSPVTTTNVATTTILDLKNL